MVDKNAFFCSSLIQLNKKKAVQHEALFTYYCPTWVPLWICLYECYTLCNNMFKTAFLPPFTSASTHELLLETSPQLHCVTYIELHACFLKKAISRTGRFLFHSKGTLNSYGPEHVKPFSCWMKRRNAAGVVQRSEEKGTHAQLMSKGWHQFLGEKLSRKQLIVPVAHLNVDCFVQHVRE